MISTRQIMKKLRKINIEDGSLLVVSEDSPIADDEHLNQLTEIIERMGHKNIGVVVTKDLNDIRSIPERQMNEAGWFRVGFLIRAATSGADRKNIDEDENAKGN